MGIEANVEDFIENFVVDVKKGNGSVISDLVLELGTFRTEHYEDMLGGFWAVT